MKQLLVLLTILLCGAITVSAQSGCGNGIPCGPIPWPLPGVPDLSSPTHMPTYAVQATDVSGAVPTPAPMPTNPPLADVDTSRIADQMATLSAMLGATPELILSSSGTPVAMTDIGMTGADTFFAYAKGLSSINLGQHVGPLVAFFMTVIVLFIFVKVATFLLPVLVSLFGIVRKIIQLVLDFLPFSVLVIPLQDWPTPTPRTFAEATAAFNIPLDAGHMVAEEVVQGYHFINADGAIDTIIALAMVLLVILGIGSILVKLRDV